MNEFDFIRRLREQTRTRNQSPRILTGIGDDASVISEAGNRDFVVTTDLLVEGVDFYRDTAPASLLGHKALAVSLSDIAAMGARPLWSLVSIGMPAEVWADDFKESFFEGYFALADRYGVVLCGGDVSEAKDKTVIDSIVGGEVNSGRAVLRSTAQPGDQIIVTGGLGGAAAGLKLIEMGARMGPKGLTSLPAPSKRGTSRTVREGSELRGTSPTVREGSKAAEIHTSELRTIEALVLRQLCPDARVGWGIVLGEERLASAMIDVSDGLS